MIDQNVYVLPKAAGRNAWRARESGKSSFRRNEHPLSQGNEFADGDAIARDDECLSLVEGAHDSSALVAELSLSNTSAHLRTV